MASLNELFERAGRRRNDSTWLRAEARRLKEQTASVSRDHAARRRACEETALRSALVRERVPSWPAWCGPTKDLRLTLVPLESPDEA